MKKSFTCTASFQLSLSEENSWKRIGTQTENETTKMKVVPVLPEQNADLDFAKQFSRRQYFQSPPYICKNAETKKVAKSRTWKEFLTSELVFCTRFGFCKIIFKANAETQTETGGKTKKMKVVLLLPAEYLRKFVKKQRQNADLGFAKRFSRWQRSSPAFMYPIWQANFPVVGSYSPCFSWMNQSSDFDRSSEVF